MKLKVTSPGALVLRQVFSSHVWCHIGRCRERTFLSSWCSLGQHCSEYWAFSLLEHWIKVIQISSEAPIPFMKVSFLKCIYLLVAALCLPSCVWAFSGYVEQELLSFCKAQALGCVGSAALWHVGAQLPCPLHWGRLLPSRPPGKSPGSHFKRFMHAKSLQSDSLRPYGL